MIYPLTGTDHWDPSHQLRKGEEKVGRGASQTHGTKRARPHWRSDWQRKETPHQPKPRSPPGSQLQPQPQREPPSCRPQPTVVIPPLHLLPSVIKQRSERENPHAPLRISTSQRGKPQPPGAAVARAPRRRAVGFPSPARLAAGDQTAREVRASPSRPRSAPTFPRFVLYPRSAPPPLAQARGIAALPLLLAPERPPAPLRAAGARFSRKKRPPFFSGFFVWFAAREGFVSLCAPAAISAWCFLVSPAVFVGSKGTMAHPAPALVLVPRLMSTGWGFVLLLVRAAANSWGFDGGARDRGLRRGFWGSLFGGDPPF